MSALGQKQTSRRARLMSALPPKADINRCIFDVRIVPKADIAAGSSAIGPNGENPGRALLDTGAAQFAALRTYVRDRSLTLPGAKAATRADI